MNPRTCCLAAVVFCTLLGTAVWAQSDQPSLGEVARRKPAVKAKVVVTNDQIPPSPEANNLPATAATSSAAGPSATSPDAGKDTAAKSKLPPEKETKLQGLQKDQADLEKVIQHLEQKIAATDDDQARTALNGVLQHAKEALAENQKQIAQIQAPAPGATQPAAPVAAGNPPPPATGPIK